MARSRHGRSGGRPSSADAGLPSWAQRHLEEAGDTAVIPVTPAPPGRRQHRAAGPAPGGLRGWGLAIVSVAAAVGAVPLAVSSVANNHTGDPLPKVDTYTAGRPGPLQTGPGAVGGTRSGPASAPQGDQATAGVLEGPPAPPEARAPIVPRRAAPVPAAVVRTTPAVVPPTAAVAPRTATATTPTSTVQGRSGTTTTKSTKPTKSSPKPAPSSNDGDGGNSGGLLGGVGNTVGGVTDAVGGVAHGLLG
jgi:hypothetical protein